MQWSYTLNFLNYLNSLNYQNTNYGQTIKTFCYYWGMNDGQNGHPCGSNQDTPKLPGIENCIKTYNQYANTIFLSPVFPNDETTMSTLAMAKKYNKQVILSIKPYFSEDNLEAYKSYGDIINICYLYDEPIWNNQDYLSYELINDIQARTKICQYINPHAKRVLVFAAPGVDQLKIYGQSTSITIQTMLQKLSDLTDWVGMDLYTDKKHLKDVKKTFQKWVAYQNILKQTFPNKNMIVIPQLSPKSSTKPFIEMHYNKMIINWAMHNSNHNNPNAVVAIIAFMIDITQDYNKQYKSDYWNFAYLNRVAKKIKQKNPNIQNLTSKLLFLNINDSVNSSVTIKPGNKSVNYQRFNRSLELA